MFLCYIWIGFVTCVCFLHLDWGAFMFTYVLFVTSVFLHPNLGTLGGCRTHCIFWGPTQNNKQWGTRNHPLNETIVWSGGPGCNHKQIRRFKGLKTDMGRDEGLCEPVSASEREACDRPTPRPNTHEQITPTPSLPMRKGGGTKKKTANPTAEW